MKWGAILVILASLAVVQTAHAQGAPGARGRNVCAPTNSQRTTVEAIAADNAGWLGKCVTVPAIYASERLYQDVDAIYGANRKSIGGYVDGQGSMDGFWTSEFTGRVSDCARAEDDLQTGLLRSPGISLNGRTLGCVRPEGVFLLFMSQGELEPAAIQRRLAPAAGDLRPAAKDWPHLAAVEKIAADFFAALQAKDKAALNALIRNGYAVDQLLGWQESAWTGMGLSVQRQVFVQGASTADAFASEVCYCRAKDCAKLWPIARRDADNQKQRPYACLRVDGARSGGTWTHSVDATLDYDGLPEPGRR